MFLKSKSVDRLIIIPTKRFISTLQALFGGKTKQEDSHLTKLTMWGRESIESTWLLFKKRKFSHRVTSNQPLLGHTLIHFFTKPILTKLLGKEITAVSKQKILHLVNMMSIKVRLQSNKNPFLSNFLDQLLKGSQMNK